MTWYWWTHWFWITSLSATISCLPLGAVDTSPSSPYQYGKVQNKREPLKFPMAVQSDSDDIFDGRDILAAQINSDWISSSETRLKEKLEVHLANLDTNKNAAEIKIPINSDNKTNFLLPKIESNGHELINQSSMLTKNESINNNQTKLETSQLTNSDTKDTIIIDTSNKNNTNNLKTIENTTSLALEVNIKKDPNISTNNILCLKNIAQDNNDTTDDVDNSTNDENDLFSKNGKTKELSSSRGRHSKILTEHRNEIKILNFSSESKNLLARSAAVSINTIDDDDNTDANDLNSEAFTIKRATILDAGAISGICFAVIGLFCAVTVTGVFLYRRRYVNKPQTLGEADSSGYIDDSTIRDNSDEMYSLDNDSFLNSLEAMTIQNYWTDSVKHTKL